jgi:hypothetical protein
MISSKYINLTPQKRAPAIGVVDFRIPKNYEPTLAIK